MDANPISQEHPQMRVEDIQYLPHHRCPQCGASARTTESGAWIRPYQDWFDAALRYWQDHLGYVYFQCDCQHHPEFRGALRVARLGDAILPVQFANITDARRVGMEPAALNAERTRQAVTFLAAHADPQCAAGTDWLAHRLYALAAGGISPERVRQELQEWADSQVKAALAGTPTLLPAVELAELRLTEQVGESYTPRKEARWTPR